MFKYLGGQLSVEVEKGLEAKRYLTGVLDRLYSEALRKEGGNIGPVLIDNLILEAEEKTQKYMKEKYPPNMTGTTQADGSMVPKAGVYQQTTAQAEAQAGKSLRLWLQQNTPDVLNVSYSTPEELLDIIKTQYPDKYEEAVSLISNFNAGGNR